MLDTNIIFRIEQQQSLINRWMINVENSHRSFRLLMTNKESYTHYPDYLRAKEACKETIQLYEFTLLAQLKLTAIEFNDITKGL